MTPPAAVSQEWRLELAQRAHSTVSSGDQESFGVETAKRVLGEFANMYPSHLFKKPTRQEKRRLGVETHTEVQTAAPKKPRLWRLPKMTEAEVVEMFRQSSLNNTVEGWNIDDKLIEKAGMSQSKLNRLRLRVSRGLEYRGAGRPRAIPHGCAHTNRHSALEKIEMYVLPRRLHYEHEQVSLEHKDSNPFSKSTLNKCVKEMQLTERAGQSSQTEARAKTAAKMCAHSCLRMLGFRYIFKRVHNIEI